MQAIRKSVLARIVAALQLPGSHENGSLLLLPSTNPCSALLDVALAGAFRHLSACPPACCFLQVLAGALVSRM